MTVPGITEYTATSAVPKRKRFYRPELDALRFMSFMMVFVCHALQVRNPRLSQIASTGNFGLSLFFLLSAYLIGELLLREQDTTGTIHLKAFFARRILRIWPLYFLGIAIGVTVGALFPMLRVAPSALPYLLLLATNFYVHHAGWLGLGAIFPLWSLAIEEQFYVIFPGIAKIGGKRALTIAAVLCLPLSYATLLWLGARNSRLLEDVWTNSAVQFEFFAAGTLLAVFLHDRRWEISNFRRVLMLLAGFAGFGVSVRFLYPIGVDAPSGPQLCIGFLCGLISTVVVFIAFLNARVTVPTWLTYLGRISFGLYVFHTIVLGLIMKVGVLPFILRGGAAVHTFGRILCLLLTILIASISYHFFERPLLRLKARFAFVKSGSEPALGGSQLARE